MSSLGRYLTEPSSHKATEDLDPDVWWSKNHPPVNGKRRYDDVIRPREDEIAAEKTKETAAKKKACPSLILTVVLSCCHSVLL